MNYIYSLSMLVPSSAYLLQPFILKLILRSPSQSILGCFAGCVRSRWGYVWGNTYLCGCGWTYVCGETHITGEHIYLRYIAFPYCCHNRKDILVQAVVPSVVLAKQRNDRENGCPLEQTPNRF